MLRHSRQGADTELHLSFAVVFQDELGLVTRVAGLANRPASEVAGTIAMLTPEAIRVAQWLAMIPSDWTGARHMVCKGKGTLVPRLGGRAGFDHQRRQGHNFWIGIFF